MPLMLARPRYLSAILWLATVFPLASAQEIPADESGVTKQTERLIEDLGSSQFIRRQQAEKELKSIGRTAEIALNAAIESRSLSLEASLRAERILFDFRYGIYPDTPDLYKKLLKQYRDHVGKSRIDAFLALANAEQFKLIENLLRLETDGDKQQLLLSLLFREPGSVKHYLQEGRVTELLDEIEIGSESPLRFQTLLQAYFSDQSILLLSESNQLSKLEEIVNTEPNVEIRSELLLKTLVAGTSVSSLCKNAGFDFVQDFLAKNLSMKQRTTLVQSLASNAAFTTSILENESFDAWVALVEELVSKEASQVVIGSFLHNSQFLSKMIVDNGVANLIALIEKIPDDRVRIQTAHIVFANPQTRVRLSATQEAIRTVDAISKLSDSALRVSLMNLFFSVTSHMPKMDSTIVEKLIQSVSSEKDPTIRKSLFSAMWNSRAFLNSIGSEEKLSSLLSLVEKNGPESVTAFMTELVGSSTFTTFLSQGELIWPITLVLKAETKSRIVILQRLFSTTVYTNRIKNENRIGDIIQFALALPQTEDRVLLVLVISQSMFRESLDQHAMGRLTQDVLSLTPSEENAALVANFTQSQYWYEDSKGILSDKASILWFEKVIDAASDENKSRLINGLLVSHELIEHYAKYVDSDSFLTKLLNQSGSVGHPAASRLLASPTYQHHLASFDSMQKLVSKVEAGAQGRSWVALVRAAFANPKTFESLTQSNDLDRLIEHLETMLAEDRLSLTIALLADAKAVHILHEKGKLETRIAQALKELTPAQTDPLIDAVASSPESIQVVLADKFQESFFNLVARMHPSRRDMVLARIIQVPGAIEVLKKFGVDEKSIERSLTSMLLNHTSLNTLVSTQGIQKVIPMIASMPSETMRSQATRALFSSSEIQKSLTEPDFISSLLESIANLQDSGARAAFVDAMTQRFQGQTLPLSAQKKLIEIVIAEQDMSHQTKLVVALLRSRSLLNNNIDAPSMTKLIGVIERFDASSVTNFLDAILANASQDLLLPVSDELWILRLVGKAEADAQDRLLKRIFTNYRFISVLRESGNSEKLVSFTLEQTKPVFRDAVLVNTLGHFVSYLTDADKRKLIGMTRQIEDPRRQASIVLKSVEASNGSQARAEFLKTDSDFRWLAELIESVDEVTRRGLLFSIAQDYNIAKRYRFFGDGRALLVALANPPNPKFLLRSESLITQPEFAEYVSTLTEIDQLAGEAPESSRDQVWQSIVSAVLKNKAATDSLTANGEFELLIAKLLDPKAIPDRSAALTSLLGSNEACRWLNKKQQLESTIREAIARTPEKTQIELCKAFLPNPEVMRYVLSSDLKKQFVPIIERQSDSNRSNLYQQWLAEPSTAVLLVESELWKDAISLPNGYSHNFLYKLGDSPKSIDELVKRGHLKKIVTAIMQVRDSRRQYLLTRIFGNSSVMKSLCEQTPKISFEDFLLADGTDTANHLLEAILSQESSLMVLLDHDRFDELSKVILSDPSLNKHAEGLMRSEAVEFWLRKKDRSSELDSFGLQLVSPESRRRYFDQVTSAKLRSVDAKQCVARVAELLEKENEAENRVHYVLFLLRSSNTLQAFNSSFTPQWLLDESEKLSDDTARSVFLETIIASEPIVDRFEKEGMLSNLISIPEAFQRLDAMRNIQASVCTSDPILQRTHFRTEILPIALALLNEKNASVPSTALSKLVQNTGFCGRFIRSGHFELLEKSIERWSSEREKESLLQTLYCDPAAIIAMHSSDRLDEVAKRLTEPDPSHSLVSTLAKLSINKTASKRLVDHIGFPKFKSHIDDQTVRVSDRRTAYGMVLQMGLLDEVIEHDFFKDWEAMFPVEGSRYASSSTTLADSRLLYAISNLNHKGAAISKDEVRKYVLAALRFVHPEASRAPLARMFARSGAVQMSMLQSGHRSEFEEILRMDGGDTSNTFRELLWAPTGAAGVAVREGKLEEATKMLRASTKQHTGKLYFAGFLWGNGLLEQEMSLTKQKLKTDTTPNSHLMLHYLQRVMGHLDDAASSAAAANDKRLQQSTAIERNDWSTAAEILNETNAALAITLSDDPKFEDVRDIERLGLLAAYNRFAGNDERARNAIKQLTDIAESFQLNANRSSRACLSLLLCGETSTALEKMSTHHPVLYIETMRARKEYDAVMKKLHWVLKTNDSKKESPTNAQLWFNELPFADNSEGKSIRFRVAAAFAGLLQDAGHEDESRDLFEVCTRFASTFSETTSPKRSELLNELVRELAKVKQFESACRVIANYRTDNDYWRTPLFTEHASAASFWAKFFAETESDMTTEERALKTFHLVSLKRGMVPVGFETDELADLHDSAIAYSRFGSAGDRIEVAISLSRVGRYDDAIALIKVDAPSEFASHHWLSKLLWENESWNEAAESLYALWKRNPNVIAYLRLSGESLKRAGKIEQGNARIADVDRSYVGSHHRFYATRVFTEFGFTQGADEQWRLLMRLAPPSTMSLIQATSRMIELADDDAEREKLSRQKIVYLLRPIHQNVPIEEIVQLTELVYGSKK